MTQGRALSWKRSIGAAVLALGVAVSYPAASQETFELTGEGWTQVAAPEPGTPEAALQDIRRALAEDRGKDALKMADAWIEENPRSDWMPAALLLRGDAKVALNDYWEALYDYEQVIIAHPSSAEYLTAVEREFGIAQVFIGGWKRKLLGFRILPTDGEGEELLIRVQERAPGSRVGHDASLFLADYYFNKQQMTLAAEAYDLFMENYPDSDRREWALLRVIQSNLARFKGPRFDGTGLIEADERLQQYALEYPASAERIGVAGLRERISESLARRDLSTADWYARRGDPVAAATMYRRLVEEFPQSRAAREAIAWMDERGIPLAVAE
ncbi:MAG: outer membrane protein assembly factor BamD [Planctomycetota bacterium]